jgi:hypothetical protein
MPLPAVAPPRCKALGNGYTHLIESCSFEQYEACFRSEAIEMTHQNAQTARPPRPRSPHFPPHNAPRVWFLTRGSSPIAIALARQVLDHGDYVVAGVVPIEFEKREGQSEDFRNFLEDVKKTERWRERLRVVGLDGRWVLTLKVSPNPISGTNLDCLGS